MATSSNTVVNTNVLALNSHRNLGKVANKQTKASQKLSSGMRINAAGDDAAGLAISEGMRSQIRGLDQASRNAQDGNSLLQTAEGAVGEIGNMVQRIRELAVQAGNDTNTTADRGKISEEMIELQKEIDKTAERTQFNKKTLIATNKSFTFQVGANEKQTMTFKMQTMNSKALKLSAGILSAKALTTNAKAGAVITACDKALSTLNSFRSRIGAAQNRMDYTVSNLDLSSENLSAAESRIRDTDMAKEMMNLTKSNVLQQAATSMLAQANQAPQNVLQLVQ